MDDCKISVKADITDSIIAYGADIGDNVEPNIHEFLLGERFQVKL